MTRQRRSADTGLPQALALLRDLYWTSPRTTFQVIPLTVIILETLRRRRLVLPKPLFLPLLAWGYLQYRLVRGYRSRLGGGSGGMTGGLPEHLVTDGPYRWVRNPMYLGHLIFCVGLVLAFRSPFALLFLLLRFSYFRERVLRDEERLERVFGDDYREYRRRVGRWLPRVPI